MRKVLILLAVMIALPFTIEAGEDSTKNLVPTAYVDTLFRIASANQYQLCIELVIRHHQTDTVVNEKMEYMIWPVCHIARETICYDEVDYHFRKVDSTFRDSTKYYEIISGGNRDIKNPYIFRREGR